MRTRCRVRGRAPRAKVRVLNTYSRMVAHFAYIQPSEDWTEWSFRLISERQAMLLRAEGELEPVTRQVMEDGEPVVKVVGYRALKPTSWERPSPATLTLATMIAVGNATDGENAEMTRRQQREVLKFRVWPLIGDTKAVCVRPRISEAEQRLAEKLAPMSPYAARPLEMAA